MQRWPKKSIRRTILELTAAVITFLGALYILEVLVTIFASDFLGRPHSALLSNVLHVAHGALFLACFPASYLVARLIYWKCLGLNRHTDYPTCGGCGYNLTGNVSDRCPECGMDSVVHVRCHLERREYVQRINATIMIVTGPVLSLAGPAVIATMFWIALRFGRFDSYVGYWQWLDLFGVLCVIMIPLLLRLELKTRGEYRAELTDTIPVPRGGMVHFSSPLRALGGVAANARVTSSLFVEFFLVGPRLIIRGWERHRSVRCFGNLDRIRAAEILVSLLKRDSGLDSVSFLRGEEKKEDIVPFLAYLSHYGWIGVGEKWGRVWLFTDSRQALA